MLADFPLCTVEMPVLSGVAKTARLTRKVFLVALDLCRAHWGAGVKLDWSNWRIVNWSMAPAACSPGTSLHSTIAMAT
jgi:hypothetical protein